MGISIALDLAEHEIFHVNFFHSRRVAYISVRIAKELGMSDDESFDLVSLAIMHDNGLTEAAIESGFSYKDSGLKALENLKGHCPIGERNIQTFPFLTKPKNIILYHHENYDGTGFYGKKAEEIPLMARIISFADHLDFNFDLRDHSFENKEKVQLHANEHKSALFDPKVVEAFNKICKSTSFWLDMQEVTINQALIDYIPSKSIQLNWSQIFDITNVFSRIIDAKSHFTFHHTGGLIQKIELMSNYYNFNKTKTIKLKIAASLHDLGKLAVPNDLLEKDAPLSSKEFDIIKIHTYFTHFTLCNLEGFQDIERWAYCHHEKLDGTGYPYGLKADDLGFEERLMSCLDIYQALTEDRPYRKGIEHDEAIFIMEEMVSKNFIDNNITQDIKNVFMRRQ
jgi:HD-GYP domain-containing protein (c-di-GMP phosphodiesterase class II)